MSEEYWKSSAAAAAMNSEDLAHNKASSQHDDGDNERADASTAGTVYDDGSVDGSEAGVYTQAGSTGIANDSLNGSSSNYGNKAPRKLQRPIQRGAQACSQCRTHKIKCIPSDSDTPFPCTRCVNQHLVCEVLKHNRGRKRKSNTGGTPPPAKRPAAVFYPTQESPATESSTKLNGISSPATVPAKIPTTRKSKSTPRIASKIALAKQSTLSLNTASSVSRASDVTSGQSQTSPIYDQSGNNLHVLEQAIAMAGNGDGGGANGQLPLPVPSSSASNAHGGPSSATASRHAGQQQQQQQLPTPYPASASYPQPQPFVASRRASHGGANEYYQQPRNSSIIAAGSSSASSSPRLPRISQQQQQHQQAHHSSCAPSISSANMPKSMLPYQYGASNYALPQPQSSMQAQQSAYTTYHHQQPSQMHNQPQIPPANVGNNSHYTYQSTFPPPSLPLPISQAQQSHSYYNDGLSGSHSGGSGGSSSNTNRSTSTMLPNVPKMTASPTRIQDSIQANSQSEALESLKFPFLLPKDERSGGRRGLFSLRNIMKPEDVEEFACAPASDANNGHNRRDSNGNNGTSSGNKIYSHEYLLATDPIQANIINQDDAHTLFKLYMDEMSVLNSLLDPTIHTHDFVRHKSKFLYCAILSVISRYLNSTTYTKEGQPRRLISPVYSYCKQAAGAHLKEILGNVETSLEVIQGLAVLTFHKGPEDEKACLHLYRAIAIAREIGLDRETLKGHHDLTEEERLWIRVKQRVWLSLFVANTILTMQFDMNTLIGPDDTAISASSRFAVGSHLQSDTLLVASVQLRRLWHIYSDMAKALEHVGESPSEKAAKLVSLSMLTRTANRELEQAAKDWKEQCVAVGLVRIDSKIDVWVAAIKLRLNLSIVQMALPGLKERASMISNGFLPPKKSHAETGQSIELGCISAFHQSVNSACYLLQCMTAMEEKRLLSFAADTFLSFSIYSAFFLWTLCRDMGPSLLEPGEVDHCFALISSAALALESASLYPGDSCALHARFLRNLQATRSGNQFTPPQFGHPASNMGSPSHGIATRMANDAMRDDNQTMNKERTTPLPASHPLAILSQMQPTAQMYDSTPPQNTMMASNQQNMMGGAPMMQGYGTGIDSMLMADWGTMQRDFPWVSSDISLPFLDGPTPAMQPLQMNNAFAIRGQESWS